MEEITVEQAKKMIEEAPDVCLITGLKKCESYVIGGNVVYLPNPAYDAYTLPTYSVEDKAFYRTRYDMDDDFRVEDEHLCDLEELENHPRLSEIKKFYNIQ